MVPAPPLLLKAGMTCEENLQWQTEITLGFKGFTLLPSSHSLGQMLEEKCKH